MSNNVLTLDDSNFAALISDSARPVLVDFSATWCGPCRKMEPILETFALEKKDSVTVGKVDVDLSPDLANKYNIRSLPTILLFKGGEVRGQVNGLVSVGKLSELVSG